MEMQKRMAKKKGNNHVSAKQQQLRLAYVNMFNIFYSQCSTYVFFFVFSDIVVLFFHNLQENTVLL